MYMYMYVCMLVCVYIHACVYCIIFRSNFLMDEFLRFVIENHIVFHIDEWYQIFAYIKSLFKSISHMNS